jgi:predicted DNA binding CopG/RHH family protein
MFSLIRKMLNQARLYDVLYERIEKIEAQLEKFEKLVDENESLWQFLDDQKEMDKLFVGTQEEFEKEFTDIMIRNMKPRGEA